MDKLDRQYRIKKFFKAIYKGLTGEEVIRIAQFSENFNKVTNFNDIDLLSEHCANYGFGNNTYFELATTNGNTGQEKDLMYRYCLGFDFDKKDFDNLTYKDILAKFNNIKLWYHCMIDSGHGFHVYVVIDKTNDLDKVNEVQRAIATRLGADLNAVKKTQLLRVPYTFNVKDEKPKQVNIIKLFDKDSIKPYSIDKLHKRFCYSKSSNGTATDNKSIEFAINSTNIPPCVTKILENGSIKGNRNADLQRIVVTFRNRNKSISEIKCICKDWNSKNKEKLSDSELEYQTEYIYNNLNNCNYNCAECEHKQKCFDKVLSDFDYSENENLIILSENHTKSLKASKRKGVKVMESNDLLVYCILKNHSDGLYRDEIIKDMTYKKKCRFSKDTLTKALSNLEDNGFIKVELIGKKKLYKINTTRSKVELTYNVSYGATYECIKGAISTEELRLYNYMRYIHNYTQRNNPNALKGNLLQVNQVDLAKDLGVTQSRVSQMINNLLEEKILGVWYRQASKNNGFDFNIYRLNY